MTIETKTREGAKVNSRLAAFSEYRVDPQNIAVGNTAPIGSLTFEQMDLGVWYPNTEAAITIRCIFESSAQTFSTQRNR